jgi:hypothetical protein
MENEPIVWLVTMCNDDTAALASTLTAFCMTRATTMTLTPLSVNGIAMMLGESSGSHEGWEQFAASLHAITHGVPSLVHASLNQLLNANQNDWQRVRTATVPIPVPARPMQRRIESLSEMEREVLLALSLIVEGQQLTAAEWTNSPALAPDVLSHVHGISRLRAARISESLAVQGLALVRNGGVQCVSPVIAYYMVTHGSSIVRDELRRRLRRAHAG